MPAVRLTRTTEYGKVGQGDPCPTLLQKGQMNVHEQMVERIDTVLTNESKLNRYGIDDESVLTYIRENLTAEAIEVRADDEFDSGSVTHLMEVAKMRLRPYEEARANAQ